jgi:PGF-pre-PGF domain-containing protein
VYELKKIILILIIIFFEFSGLTQVHASEASENTNSTINADFLAFPISGIAPLTVQFKDESSGDSTTWEWDFNSDGKIDSTIKDPLYKFLNPGNYNVTLKVGKGTTWDSITRIDCIKVGIRPVAGFTATPNEGKVPLTVKFTDTSTGNVTYWLWNFGDNSTSNLQSPNHTYYEVGNYKVSLTVSNAFEHSTLESRSLINVSSTPALIADFNSNVILGKAPLTVHFNDLSTGNPTVWEWDFNSDGQVDSKERNPIYTFKISGTYTVTMRAGSSTSWSVITKTNYITIGNGLQASFMISPNLGTAPLSVKFTDTSIGAKTAWLWDFGDNSTSTLQNPIHIYNQAGTYAVKLTVSNNIGSNTSEIPSAVNVSSVVIPVSEAPVVDFKANVTSGEAPLTVHFYDNSTRNPVFWEWDFNSDGQIDSNDKNPVCVFTNPGNYTVTLRSGNGIAWENVTKINYITVESKLQASFTASPLQGNAPLTVQFTDNSMGNINSRLWNFGDGNTSYEQNPSHVYSKKGNFTVKLIVNNALGSNSTTKTDYIDVGVGPVANFTANKTAGIAPLTVKFTDRSTGAPTNWTWNFGDGNGSYGPDPTHTYYLPGIYSVTLNVSDLSESSVHISTDYITVTNDSESSNEGGGSSSSGTGSSGGMGGSPEPVGNIAVKLLAQNYITAGNHVIFEFTNNSTCIDRVEFDAKKMLGKTTVTVEQLKARSVKISKIPAGNRYKYVNIWVGNSGIDSQENIENATIKFRVSKDYFENNDVESTVVLQRYSKGKWNLLDTIKTGGDDRYSYYQAKTPGFSQFALTSGNMSTFVNYTKNPNGEDISLPDSYDNELSIQSKQPEKPEQFDNKDSDISGKIELLIVAIVVLFIGLAVREKMK